MASKVGTADIMWTYELSTDDHEAISFHMGYIKKKKRTSLLQPCHKEIQKKNTKNFASCQKIVICVEKYFKVFWKFMLCWLGVT